MAIVETSGKFDASVSMGSTAVALPCGISFTIPYPPSLSVIFKKFKITLPGIPKIPFSFSLNCDPSKPINITAGLPWGGGRVSNVESNNSEDGTVGDDDE